MNFTTEATIGRFDLPIQSKHCTHSKGRFLMKTVAIALLAIAVCIPGNCQTGPIVSTSVNQQLYANAFPGNDLGAQINAAIASWKTNGGACDIRATPGTIATQFQLPSGCSITFTPGSYPTSVELWAAHRNSIWNMNHAQILSSLDNGTSAFFVGKKSAGVVSTNGTTVTWVSGTNFAQIDAGDILNINGASHNVASVNSNTVLTLLGSAGTQTDVLYEAYLSGVNGIGQSNTVTIKDLWLLKTSGTATPMDGLHIEGAAEVLVDNATVEGFSNTGSYAYHLIGSISGEFIGLKTNSNAACLNLSGRQFGGARFDSNENAFIKLDCSASTGSKTNATILFASYGAYGNNFYGLRNEGNTNSYQLLFLSGACRNRVFGLWDERDGANDGADWQNNSGCQNSLYGGLFNAPLGTNESAIATGLADSYSAVEDVDIVGAYQHGWIFPVGTGRLINVSTGSLANLGTPTIISSAGTVPHVGNSSVGNATCIKSNGPPIVIGYCSTAVNSSGSCTCN